MDRRLWNPPLDLPIVDMGSGFYLVHRLRPDFIKLAAHPLGTPYKGVVAQKVLEAPL